MRNNKSLIPSSKNLINAFDFDSVNENYVLVEIDSRSYALYSKDVLEIIQVLELDHFNDMPSYNLGIVKYNENPVNVIDLREVFKTQRIIYGLRARIVFVKTEKGVASIICDRIQEIKKLEKEYIRNLPYQQGINFFEGLYINNDENVYILNMNNIIKYLETHPEKYIRKEEKNYIINNKNAVNILKERKNFLTKANKEEVTLSPLYAMGVSFLINDVKYYINMTDIKEFYMVNKSKFIKIPHTKDFILGLVNIKGDYVTVIDIRKFYGNSKTTIKEKSTIIILNSTEYKIGILADEICESMNIDFDKIPKSTIQTQEDYKTYEFVLDNEVYQIIDTEKLLKDERLGVY